MIGQDAGELGLNIVCQQDVTPLVKRKRAKKYNKYEKRRAKARQARHEKKKKLSPRKSQQMIQ